MNGGNKNIEITFIANSNDKPIPNEQYIFSNGIYVPISIANPLPTSVVRSLANDITFHDAATATADGTVHMVNGEKILLVEILSTATSFTIAFKGRGPTGADIALMGVNLSNFSTGTTTSTSGQLWQFDITGLTAVLMDLTAITAGAGSVTVKGRAVA